MNDEPKPDDYWQQRLLDGAACKNAALEYATLGWSVLHLCTPDHAACPRGHGSKCASPGKAPLGQWKELQTKAATHAQIQEWWGSHGVWNVGIVTGDVSRLVAIDADSEEALEKLKYISGGVMPTTLEFKTPGGSGNYRWLYQLPENFGAPTAIVPVLDKELRFMANGSQTVMPPSRHKDGGLYAWTPGRGPGEVPLADAPDWLLKALKKDKAERRQNYLDERRLPDADKRIDEGHRNDSMHKLASWCRGRGLSYDAIYQCVSVENQKFCNPPLPDSEIVSICKSASKYTPTESYKEKRWKPPAAVAEDREKNEVELAIEQNPIAWINSTKSFMATPIERIIQRGNGSTAEYEFIMQEPDGVKRKKPIRIFVGGVKNLLNPNAMRAALLADLKVIIPLPPKNTGEWNYIAEAITRAAEYCETDSDQDHETIEWIDAFVAGYPAGHPDKTIDPNDHEMVKKFVIRTAEECRSGDMRRGQGFFWSKKGVLYLDATMLHRFVTMPPIMAKTNHRDIRIRLSVLRFEKFEVQFRHDAAKVHTRLWQSFGAWEPLG